MWIDQESGSNVQWRTSRPFPCPFEGWKRLDLNLLKPVLFGFIPRLPLTNPLTTKWLNIFSRYLKKESRWTKFSHVYIQRTFKHSLTIIVQQNCLSAELFLLVQLMDGETHFPLVSATLSLQSVVGTVCFLELDDLKTNSGRNVFESNYFSGGLDGSKRKAVIAVIYLLCLYVITNQCIDFYHFQVTFSDRDIEKFPKGILHTFRENQNVR